MSAAKFTIPFHRFRITDTGMIRHNRAEHPPAGAHADISSTGWGPFRRSYLIVTGPGWSHSVRIDSMTMGRAQAFAAAVNAASQQAATIRA